MSEEIPAQNNDSFLEIFRKHDAVMLLIEPETGRILDANIAAEKFYGYSLTQLMGMKMSEINAPLPDQLSAEWERKHPVFQHKLANAEIRTIEAQVSKIHINGRAVNLSIIHDVSGRQQMNAALRESEERYRSLFENMIDGIYRSIPEGRFVDINTAMVKMFGYSSKEEMLAIDI